MNSATNDSPSINGKSRRRHVTIMFSDLCDSTFLGQTIDPEILADVFHHVRETAERVVEKHGGIVNQFYGDGVLAIFGFPTPHEDDVRRATEAALELHASASELPLTQILPETYRVQLHSGVHSGLVAIGQGDPAQGRFELIGDAMNTAAGLCANAEAGEIIVSAKSLGEARAFFETAELPPISLKGKTRAIAAYRVSSRTSVQTRFEARTRRVLTPFVGRESEISRLHDELTKALAGNLQLASIIGYPGLGKSRLLDEFLGQIANLTTRTLRGYCETYERYEESGSAAPLQPFLQMLQQYFQVGGMDNIEASTEEVQRALTRIDPTLAGSSTELLASMLIPRARSTDDKPTPFDPTAVSELTSLFLAIAKAEPIVLALDDWQWADDASRKLLSNLARSGDKLPILIVAAARELNSSDPAMLGQLLALEPFDVGEVAHIVDTLLSRDCELGLTEKIHQRSGGNALFIEELCQSLLLFEDERFSETAVSEVPETLHGLIEARLEHLPEDQSRLLRCAAVIGQIVPLWLLEGVSDADSAISLLAELTRSDLIYATDVVGVYRFKHGIARDVVYDTVGLRDRRDLHTRIAAALETKLESGDSAQNFENLAYHFAAASQHRKASEYAELAGDRALVTSALDHARQQYRDSLNALNRQEETDEMRKRWISITERWALASSYSPARSQLEILRRTAEYAVDLDDTFGLTRAETWLGWINYALGDQTAAINHFKRAQRLVTELGDDRMTVQVMANLGQACAAACDYSHALTYLDESLEAKDKRSADPRAKISTAYAMACKAFVLADRGQFSEAVNLISDARTSVANADQPIEASILALHSGILLWQGLWNDAIAMAQLAQTAAERVSGPYVFAMSRAQEGYARWILERDSAALDMLKTASEWLEAQEMWLYVSFNYGWLADAMATAGRDREAVDYGTRALRRAAVRDRVGEAMACRALATVTARNQDLGLETPEHYLGLARQSAHSRDSQHEVANNMIYEAALNGKLGNRALARELLDRAQNSFEDMSMSWHVDRAKTLARRL